jgi:putative hydrolase of the HAD superfamily
MIEFPEAIFFDLDGTLLDPSNATMEADWRASCEVCCDGSYEVEQLMPHVHAVRTWFWQEPERARRGRMDLNWARTQIVRDAFSRAGLPDDEELASRIGRDYFERRESAMQLYPASIALLERVRAEGVRTALLTNGGAEMQRGKVVRFELAPHFDCIVIEGEFGVGKPDERVFRHALASTGADPASAWMVGDNPDADIAPAVALGLHAVWVNEDGVEAPEHVRPHRVVRSIAELL